MTHFINEEYPRHAETLKLLDYKVTEKTPSAFLPNETYLKEVGFNCPFCNKLNPFLEHGDALKCTCGLKCQVYGLSLLIWGNPKEKKVKERTSIVFERITVIKEMLK